MKPSLAQTDAHAALRAFLLAVLPAGTEIVRGQGNRVAMPACPDFVVVTAIRRDQLATTTHDYAPPADPIPAIGSEDIGRSTALAFQLDIYGPAAGDNAQVVTNLLRDAWGCAFLKDRGVQPLTCEDPRQMPIVAGEQQYIERWTVSVILQANMYVTVPMEFAETLITTLEPAK